MKFLLLSFFPLLAQAHLEPGTYTGVTAEKATCSMVVGEQYFVDDKPHPLNERIRITVNGVEFVVGHPTVFDSAQDLISFNHDLFQGVVPTATGARALEVVMTHEAGKEGPVSFSQIENFWKTGKKAAIHCAELSATR